MLAYLYLLFALAFRFVPHGPFSSFCQSCGLWNFTPVAASLLYFGARQPRRRMWLPVAAFASSDVLLTTLVYHARMDAAYLVTWAWYAVAILMGSALQQKLSVARVAGASIAASLSFFVLSNFMVWATGTMYPHSLAGLAECYAAAVPFFRNTALGDLGFSALFFGLPFAVTALRREPAARAAA